MGSNSGLLGCLATAFRLAKRRLGLGCLRFCFRSLVQFDYSLLPTLLAVEPLQAEIIDQFRSGNDRDTTTEVFIGSDDATHLHQCGVVESLKLEKRLQARREHQRRAHLLTGSGNGDCELERSAQGTRWQPSYVGRTAGFVCEVIDLGGHSRSVQRSAPTVGA